MRGFWFLACPLLFSIITLLPRSWKQSRKHVVIVGDGGMGKTFSLVRLWESLLIKSFLGVQGPHCVGRRSKKAAGSICVVNTSGGTGTWYA